MQKKIEVFYLLVIEQVKLLYNNIIPDSNIQYLNY